MFEIFLTNTANKSQKKLDKALRLKIRDSLLELADNPEKAGEKLTSPLTDIYSYHVKYQGKEFRIAYTIDNENLIVVIHLIAAHENFYKKLKLLMDNR